jgi:hypothetical protein
MTELANICAQLILKCPHCNEYIIIEKINCAIFRHGVLKANGEQIDPHSPKELCEYYLKNNLIYGCGNPFRIKTKNGLFETEKCGYI